MTAPLPRSPAPGLSHSPGVWVYHVSSMQQDVVFFVVVVLLLIAYQLNTVIFERGFKNTPYKFPLKRK